MYDIELRIKLQDWVYILIIGILLGGLLSTLGYILLEQPWLQGLLYGVQLGFLITLFSLTFITFMNLRILPHLSKRFWVPMAMFFSWLSGFLGTVLSVYLAKYLHIVLIPMFDSRAIQVSIAVGLLTYIVGALLYRFVKMRNEKEEIDHHYIQSRLSSLETQLNPHFMFNALNSIAELIHQDPVKAEEAILKVSSFLRNTMDEKALIPLKDELRNVTDYVELENIRFSGKIKLDISKTIPSWDVPKFSIQLLVENAIKHGLDAQSNTLTIAISFNTDKQIIIVQNNGKPIHSTHFGIGLNNLNQRIKLLCFGSLKIIRTDLPTFYIYLGDCHENSHRR